MSDAAAAALGPRWAHSPRRPKLVGRDRELQVLEAELARAVAGEFRCLLLVGDAGLGKTRLAEEVLTRHSPPGIGVSARAHPLGGTTSFGLWAEALEGQLRALDARDVSAVCGGFLDDLAALLRSAAAARGSPPQVEPPRSRLLEGLAVVMANVAAVAPVVVFLDDIHLADPSSWDALHYLARNLSESRVLVLAGARPAELHGQAGPTQILLAMEQDGRLRRLGVEPLETEAVGALAGAVLGRAPEPALVAWLDERSRGSPLFALGLIRALQDEGADLAAPRLRRIPEALAERVIARVDALDEPARSTLEVLAVIGRRVELGNVVTLTGRLLDGVGPLLDGLVRSRLVTVKARGREVIYEIAHPLIQEAIYEDLGAARRRALHRLVARSLLAGGRLGEAAPHFARSAEVGDPEAIDALREAVRQAEERELYQEALTILGALVELLPPGDERWLEVLDALGLRADWVIDHRADVHAALAIPALRAMDSLLERFPDPARRAAVKYRLTCFLSWGTGQLEEAQRAARDARDLFEQAGDSEGVLLANLELAFLRGFEGDLRGWFTGALEVAAAAEAAGHRLVAMHAVGRAGFGALTSGRFEDAEGAFRRGIEMAREHGKTYFQTNSLTGLATSLAFEGRVAEALPILDEAKALNPNWRESLLGEYEIMIRWLTGAFSTALAGAQESVAWNAAGMSRRRAIGMAFAALAAVEAGQPADARRYLDLALATYEGRSWWIWTDCCSHAEAMVALLVGDLARARISLRRTAESYLGKGTCPWTALPLVDLAEVAARTGNSGDAAWAAMRLEELALQVDRDLYRALASLGRAWSDLASSGSTLVSGSAERAVEMLSPTGYRGFLGRALEVLGRSLAHHDRARAREVLARAVATFDACGAARRQAEALRDLRRLGEAGKRAAAALGPPVLTPREAEVARLAVKGGTAAEIGKALFIGTRTVESHLARVYAKLGVTSKYELAQRAGELNLTEAQDDPY